ncbi:methionine-gamma-lyase [Duganella sp. CF402]|uniref:trans-sulfuration enzyme family protein n=1 Tax=unclassified Duganella TaxID=2636909 RepID=UPI0008D3E1F1|nr:MULTISPECIES: PLP-dependent aspartate aminotransferase family protein [unclassified Duganella]RZT08149.1 methionine-gamma-lyase [Duganella sp. BK701]SEM03924.1 methionine-gamma-lyase [Duganella sp. CF402]
MFKNDQSAYGFRTMAIHAGKCASSDTGALALPIYATTSFGYGDFDSGERRFAGVERGFLYSRFSNPTVQVFEQKMALLEGGETALAASSGMAAICAALFGLLSAGDELIFVGTLYGGTLGVMQTLLPRMGVNVLGVKDVGELGNAITAKTKLVYVETPSNPTLEIIDLGAVAALAREHAVISIADNTFATPYLTRPIDLGIDIVVHSATKYIGGHGDATGGVVIGSKQHIELIRTAGVKQFGGCMSPQDAFLFVRGLKTLPLRMEAVCDSALAIAQALHRHPLVEQVFYPGLAAHAGHDIAARQMKKFGGILAFTLRGGKANARRFLNQLMVITQAVSVGDVDSLACHPASTTHSAVPAEVRLQQGVTDQLIRLSVGIEDLSDLLTDIYAALAALTLE